MLPLEGLRLGSEPGRTDYKLATKGTKGLNGLVEGARNPAWAEGFGCGSGCVCAPCDWDM